MGDHRSGSGDLILTVLGCLLVAGVPLAFSTELFDSGLLPKLIVLTLCSLSLSGWWLIRPERVRPVVTPVMIPVGMFLTAVCFAAFRALDPTQGILQVTKLFSLFVVLVILVRGATPSDWIVWGRVIAVVGTVISAVGILQFHNIAFLSLPSAGYPSATFPYRNLAAGYTISVVPYTLYHFFRSKRPGGEVIWTVCWATQTVFLLYTRTRGAWVAGLGSLAVGAVLVLLNAWRSGGLRHPQVDGTFLRKTVLAAAAGVCVWWAGSLDPSSAMVYRPQVSYINPSKQSLGSAASTILSSAGDITTGAPSVGSGRLGFWQSTIQMISERPWAGVGLSNWDKIYPLYRIEGGGPEHRWPSRPHNDYLWVFSEIGVIGFLSYVGIFVAVAFVILRECLAGRSDGLAISATVSLAAVQAHALLSFPIERPGILTMAWFSLALIGWSSRRYPTGLILPRWQRSAAAMAVATLVCGLYVAGSAYVAEALTARGIVQLGTGDRERALRAIRMNRKWIGDYKLLMYQSRIFLETGFVDSAMAVCEEVVRRHPNTANGLQNLGKVAFADRDLDGAARSIDRAILVRPRFRPLYEDLIRIHTARGDYTAALEVTDRAATVFGNAPWIPYLEGGVYSHEGRVNEALSSYSTALERDTTYTEALVGLANSYLRAGKVDSAYAAYEICAKRLPEDPHVQYVFGSLLLSRGDRQRGTMSLRKALEVTDDGDLVAEIREVLSRTSPEHD